MKKGKNLRGLEKMKWPGHGKNYSKIVLKEKLYTRPQSKVPERKTQRSAKKCDVNCVQLKPRTLRKSLKTRGNFYVPGKS